MNCEAAAERAVCDAPGVLAAKADYDKQTIIVGTKKDEPVPSEEILAALKSIGYQGELADPDS